MTTGSLARSSSISRRLTLGLAAARTHAGQFAVAAGELDARFLQRALDRVEIVGDERRHVVGRLRAAHGHHPDLGLLGQLVRRPAHDGARGADLRAGDFPFLPS